MLAAGCTFGPMNRATLKKGTTHYAGWVNADGTVNVVSQHRSEKAALRQAAWLRTQHPMYAKVTAISVTPVTDPPTTPR